MMLRRGPTMELLYRSNAPEGDLEGPAAVSSPPPPEEVYLPEDADGEAEADDAAAIAGSGVAP
ncbi:MAG: hypothetical protein U0900_09330 [Myxococcota bacterium]